jgi:ferredoxin
MVKINKEKCIGCGACVSICSAVFEMKNGKAIVKKQSNEPCVQEAIDSCPVKAISK